MEIKDVAMMSYERMWKVTDGALEGLTHEEFARRPNGHSNSIGWIAWHMARVEDRWTNMVLNKGKQLWETHGWAEKIGMPNDPNYSGGGMTPDQVQLFKTPAVQQVKDYWSAVRATTKECYAKLTPSMLDQMVQTPFRRELKVGDVISHVLCELNQHAGQVAYLRGYYKG
ncbi:MAG: DinB family protein [Chloroflexi bacterium]|nr:DinB family protein [Chloroflexota bacterium]